MYKKQGSIIAIHATKQVNDKFKNRTFVVKTEENYPQSVQFELTQDRVDYMDNYKVGDKVDVNFVVNGREWTDPKTAEIKYFNSVVALSVVKVGESSNHAPSPDSGLGSWQGDGDQDLPF